MSTGVQVSDECLTTFQELKKDRKYKYIFLGIKNEEIVVEKTIASGTHDDLVKNLSEDRAYYVIVDHEYEIAGEGKRNKLCFIAWVPDNLGVKQKMIYAGSKSALKDKLGDIKEIQANDISDIDDESILTKA
ncbi:cofilin [Syncephalis fuscata]|nr:cofilin [Syncephalis fuscata]